jgi:predicted metal-dependent hydrolase
MNSLCLKELQARHPQIHVGDLQFPIRYRHNKRAKRFSARISLDYQHLIVTLPLKGTYTELHRFLNTCTQWAAKHHAKWAVRKIQALPFQKGAEFPILGQMWRLHIDTHESAMIGFNERALHIPEHLFHGDAIQAFLNERLLAYVTYQSNVYASQLGAKLNAIRIKPLKSSYGICTSKKTITYASKLVFAPLEVIDYVCAHEVAHLIEMNHSAAFWKIVNHLNPNYQQHKAWLTSQGYKLSFYGNSHSNPTPQSS